MSQKVAQISLLLVLGFSISSLDQLNIADSEPCRSGFRGHADQSSEVMPIKIPRSCRSGFRTDADQENDRVGDDVGTKLGTTE
jgi:hypothetical protein